MNRGDLSERKKLEDYIVRRIFLRLANTSRSPVNFHVSTTHTEPGTTLRMMDMTGLEETIFQDKALSNQPFIITHAGAIYPGARQVTALLFHYGNVYADCSEWSYYEYNGGVNAVVTMTEAAPAHKLLWGTDGTVPEIFTGSAITSRRMLADALQRRVDRLAAGETQDSTGRTHSLQERKEALRHGHQRVTILYYPGDHYVYVERCLRSSTLGAKPGTPPLLFIRQRRSSRWSAVIPRRLRLRSWANGSSSPGSLAEVKAFLGDRPCRVDDTFASKVVLPGFIDQHLHPLLGALTLAVEVIAPEDWLVPGKTWKKASTRQEYHCSAARD